MTRYAAPRTPGNPANTSLNKICTEHDGHKHVMYKIKSPYAGAQGLRLDTCLGCGLMNQQDWYECLHCIRKRCQQDRFHPKESKEKMEFFDGATPSPLPSPKYPRS
jgi:Rieske Fe-S protein